LVSSNRNFKFNAWIKYEIELILDSKSEANDENCDERSRRKMM
jgi:hypothetical protein